MNNDNKKLADVIQELMEERGISLEKLAYITNIPQRFLLALKNGEFNKLPAKPYVRGYLLKIATVLEVDPEIVLRAYKESAEIKSSGTRDRLPTNRFAKQRFNKNLALAAFVLIILVAFFGIRVKSILGTPTITLSIPDSTLITIDRDLKVSGRISPGDRLTLNEEMVYTNNDGAFEKEVNLSSGLNTLEFRVTRFLGREIKVMRQVFYEPQ